MSGNAPLSATQHEHSQLNVVQQEQSNYLIIPGLPVPLVDPTFSFPFPPLTSSKTKKFKRIKKEVTKIVNFI
uniref:Uncharacterized protein n=1 Tax=Meloidogyne enterolobii TaxID=390850 RepID=A0A6V7X040_MELEN|nr:unnamed protein product [Meloidogyne enterolobii]